MDEYFSTFLYCQFHVLQKWRETGSNGTAQEGWVNINSFILGFNLPYLSPLSFFWWKSIFKRLFIQLSLYLLTGHKRFEI